jgi:molecular chaperone HtpG
VSQATTISFLEKSSVRRLRRDIKTIVDSYSHFWDILAEIVQNSVDAIRQYSRSYPNEPREHSIDVSVNALLREIVIRDTGIGFSADNFAELLAPHGTDKDNDPQTIGEKGVGLTYTVFSCNRYELTTRSATATISGFIEGGVAWRAGHTTQLPTFSVTEWKVGSFAPQESMTQIKLIGLEQSPLAQDDLVQQTADVLEFLLRTKTAIGWVKGLFENQHLSIQVTLNVVGPTGKKSKRTITPEFLFPHLVLAENKSHNLDEFLKLAATLDDRQKAKRLQGKAIYKYGSVQRAGRTINFYMFFAPNRAFWKEISEKHKYYVTTEDDERHYLMTSGIYLATRGMPTSVELEPPETGAAGYWSNILILLEDDSFVFDLGRKSVPNRTKGLLRSIAKQLFNEVIPFAQYTTANPAVSMSSATVQNQEKSKRPYRNWSLRCSGVECSLAA